MFLHKLCAAAMIVAMSATMASATPVSPFTLYDGITVTQTVNVEDDSGLLNNANWFVFSATAGDLIDIDINRLAAPPDLVSELYFGDVSGLDFGTSSANFGAANGAPLLSFLLSADDTEDDAFGGPFGDPRFTFTAAQTGIYSFYVATLTAGIDSPFEVTATGIAPAPVPLPAGFPLLAGALGLFGWIGARRRAKQA